MKTLCQNIFFKYFKKLALFAITVNLFSQPIDFCNRTIVYLNSEKGNGVTHRDGYFSLLEVNNNFPRMKGIKPLPGFIASRNTGISNKEAKKDENTQSFTPSFKGFKINSQRGKGYPQESLRAENLLHNHSKRIHNSKEFELMKNSKKYPSFSPLFITIDSMTRKGKTPKQRVNIITIGGNENFPKAELCLDIILKGKSIGKLVKFDLKQARRLKDVLSAYIYQASCYNSNMKLYKESEAA